MSLKPMGQLAEDEDECTDQKQFLVADLHTVNELHKLEQSDDFEAEIVWRNVILFAVLHLGALVGLYQVIFVAKWISIAWGLSYGLIGGLGVSAGAHRLWTHRSYKARWPARLILMLLNCIALQNDVIEWSRDHRSHHKWTDTVADPHNSTRGLFFSHMGWLMLRKHPEVRRQGAKLDLSDLYADPILRFQRRYYIPLIVLLSIAMPMAIPIYGWGEKASVGFFGGVLFRLCLSLHVTWLTNSAAHRFGYRPYDPKISPTDSFWTSFVAMGEGGHNYHHTFPQDYRTSEFPIIFNWTKPVIDMFAALGWAYDRKVATEEIIERQKTKHLKSH